MAQDDFDWGELGRDWWVETATTCGATEKHARFAAAKHRGASNAAAARSAGFGAGNDASARSEGYRLARSNRIMSLLALAAAKAGGGYDGTLTRSESRQILTGLARGSDPALRIKAIESLNKLDADESAGRPTEEQTTEQAARELMALCRPEEAPRVWGEIVLRGYQWHAPFIKLIVPYLAAHHEAEWRVYRGILIGDVNQMAADIARLEAGPLLSLEEILTAAGVGRPVTPGCAFDGGQSDALQRETALKTNGAEVTIDDVA